MNAELDTLPTAPYVMIDDDLANHPEWIPQRPVIGVVPNLSDAELSTLAVLQALLGDTSEARFIRNGKTHLTGLFPYISKRPG